MRKRARERIGAILDEAYEGGVCESDKWLERWKRLRLFVAEEWDKSRTMCAIFNKEKDGDIRNHHLSICEGLSKIGEKIQELEAGEL